jgi:CRP/FNR family transcriptional regulator, nitrogen oxide reductase regulator
MIRGHDFPNHIGTRALFSSSSVGWLGVRLRGWSRETLGPLLQRHPQVRMDIMRELASHMTDALTRVRELTTERVGQRLAHTLSRLVQQCGRPTADGLLITYPLTRQELAGLTGTILSLSAARSLKWETAGVLRSEGRRLLVRSPRGLEELAADDEA